MSQKPPRIRVEAERLRNGPITHDIDVPPQSLDLLDDPEYEFREQITGQITATLVGSNVLITGNVKTIASVPCARCLFGLRIPLQTAVTLVYMQDERLRDPVRYPELYEDNTFWYDGDIVYPGEQLREQLLLQLPAVAHCELEDESYCPIRGVRLGPMVFGPLGDAPEEDRSLAAQVRRLRKDMGS